MILEYNAPNEVILLQLDLGSYKFMSFDTTSTKISNDWDEKSKVPISKDKIMTQFIDNMVTNLECLREEVDPNILLIQGFFWLHCMQENYTCWEKEKINKH